MVLVPAAGTTVLFTFLQRQHTFQWHHCHAPITAALTVHFLTSSFSTSLLSFSLTFLNVPTVLLLTDNPDPVLTVLTVLLDHLYFHWPHWITHCHDTATVLFTVLNILLNISNVLLTEHTLAMHHCPHHSYPPPCLHLITVTVLLHTTLTVLLRTVLVLTHCPHCLYCHYCPCHCSLSQSSIND